MACIFLPACGGDQAADQHSAQKPDPQPGMRVYKDPVTGDFVPQPPAEDRSTVRVLPQSLQQANQPSPTPAPVFDPAQEYESPTEGGGILLDLPAPYSETKE